MSLESHHLQEWLNSGVDEELIALNVRSLCGTTPYEYLLYSPKISRRNDGRLRDRDLKKYQHIELGGWWCNGVDPLSNYEQMLWGCFKPDKPRRDSQKIHKFIKYEHPYREQTRAFFLQVTKKIWVKVSNRCGIPITDEDLQHPGGFWHWVWKNNVPIVIVEGAKKAACLLSAGYAAIAISGVNAGYRTPQEEDKGQGAGGRGGNLSPMLPAPCSPTYSIGKPSLIPDLKHFATPNRQVNICFDNDTKPETVQRVRTAISRMGRLLISEGCQLRVIDLPGIEKGVDDFVVAHGVDSFHALYNTAETLELWEIKLFTLLTYPPAIALNQRFLGGLIAPKGEKLIVLKAPKGTGKTEWLSQEVAKAHDQGRKVLIITHRIQLGEALCDRFGVDYVSEIKTSDTGGLLGYGVCVDSLHKDSQAHFNPNDWSNDVIIIDECDQVFWHLLNSTTDVAKRRVSVLRNFKQLVQNVLGSEHGKIYLSSADASDTDVKYILSLAGEYRVNPFVIVNNYQPVSGKCYNYSGSNPKNLIAALDKAIARGLENQNCRVDQAGERGSGGAEENKTTLSPAPLPPCPSASQNAGSSCPPRFLLCCSAQKAKSKWGTQALEQRFRQKFPHLRILRIDSHSVLDPKHPAFECIAHLNQILTQYDLVIASPSLETGVSIDIRGHFNSVWGIFQGVQPVDSVRQMLARLRETVDRHIWVSRYGMGTVGNGSTSMGGLLRSQDIATQANIALLSAADNDDYSFIDQNFQPESLQTWGKRGAVINVEMRRYQEFVLKGLAVDGYTIIDADDSDPDETKEVVKEVKAASKELYAGQCLGVSESDDVSDAELKKLQEKRVKTDEERYQQRKGELSRRYEVEVTPELVEKDDDGWYPQLRLHYYLTVGRQFLVNRDSKRAKGLAEAGENAIWKPDFNKGQMLSSVLLLSELNLLQLLTSEEQFRGSDQKMQEFKAHALQHRYLIKNYLNVTVSEKLTPVAIAQKLLDKIDLRLSYVGRLGPRGKRECVYKFVMPNDGRDGIFKQWLNRELVSVTNNIELQTQVADTTPLPSNQDMGGQENSTHSWWQQIKSYAALVMERVKDGVGAVKEFLSTLSSDERWGVIVALEEAQPVVFGQLVAAAPNWMEWMA